MRTLLVIFFLAAPFVASAQVFHSCEDFSMPVTMQLTSEITATVPSVSLGIYAEMQNTGTAVISGASIAVDVVQKNTGTVIDRFVAPQQITILPESRAKVGFLWKVPAGIDSGTYAVQATFAPSNATRAEVFTHVFPTATLNIVIKDGAATPASIRSLRVNGSVYTPNTVARFANEGHVSAIAAATNDIAAPYRGSVAWKLYAPDAALGDVPLDTRKENVDLHPNTSDSLEYTLPDLSRGSYYLEGELSDGHSSSFFDILLARDDAAFPWSKCAAVTSQQNGTTGSTTLVVSIIVAILLLGGALAYVERRKIA